MSNYLCHHGIDGQTRVRLHGATDEELNKEIKDIMLRLKWDARFCDIEKE